MLWLSWAGQVLCVLCMVMSGPWIGGLIPGSQGLVLGVTCVGQGACGCVFDDGSGTIDVSSLGNTNGVARFRNVKGQDQFLYSYNPCYAFSEGKCSEAAVCQINNKTQDYVQIGDAKSVRWLNGSQAYLRLQTVFTEHADAAGWMMPGAAITQGSDFNITAYYEHQEQGPSFAIRESFVTYVCDPEAVTPRLDASGGDGTQVFFFRLTTQCACPNGCVRTASGAESLSAGSVLLIIFFAAVLVYVVGGMVMNRVGQQSSGPVTTLPHAAFWQALPGYVKDGCLFVTCQFRRTKQTYTEVS